MNEKPEHMLTDRRVLVVEDEFFLADDLARELASNGATVLGPANTLRRAQALLDGGRIDLAVLDVNIKGQFVFALAEQLRRRGVPFVFATGYSTETIPAAFQDVDRWEKPFPVEGLVRALEQMSR